MTKQIEAMAKTYFDDGMQRLWEEMDDETKENYAQVAIAALDALIDNVDEAMVKASATVGCSGCEHDMSYTPEDMPMCGDSCAMSIKAALRKARGE